MSTQSTPESTPGVPELDEALLSILACPAEHHAPLTHDAAAHTLTCTECGRIFDVVDGIPVLLLDEARLPGGAA